MDLFLLHLIGGHLALPILLLLSWARESVGRNIVFITSSLRGYCIPSAFVCCEISNSPAAHRRADRGRDARTRLVRL
jgi:hypothetical protein